MDRFLSERETADRNFSIGYYLKENQVHQVQNKYVIYLPSEPAILAYSDYSNDILLYLVLSTWHLAARDHGPLLPGIYGVSSSVYTYSTHFLISHDLGMVYKLAFAFES